MLRILTFLRKCKYIIMNQPIEYMVTWTHPKGGEMVFVYDFIEEAREARARVMETYGVKGVVISTRIKSE